MNTDGRPELFLSTSLQFRNLTGRWKVFAQSTSGEWTSFDRLVTLRGDELIVRPGKSGVEIWCVYPPDRDNQRTVQPDEWKQTITRYSFAFPQVITSETQLSEAQLASIKEQPTTTTTPPLVEGVLLAEFFDNPSTRWAPLDFRTGILNSFGFYLSKQDAIKVKALGMFTPALALQKIENIMSDSTSDGVKQASMVPESRSQKPSPISKPAAVKPTAPSEEPNSSTPWGVTGILTVAVLSLLWLLVKKRK